MKVTPASSAAWITRMPCSSDGRSWRERCIPPNPTEETAGAPGPSGRLCKAQLFGQAGPVLERDGPVILERREHRQDLSARALDPAIAQLTDHSGESLVVRRGIEIALLPSGVQAPELFSYPSRGNGFERSALGVRHHGLLRLAFGRPAPGRR